MRIFTGAESVEDFVDSRNGELAKNTEFVQLLEVDRDADVVRFLHDDYHWIRPWRCGVLDETRGEELVQIRVHFLGGRRLMP